MQDVGKSTLIGKVGIMCGFAWGTHLHKPGWFMSMVFYRLKDSWVVCISEGEGPFYPDNQRHGMGRKVDGMLFAPFAARRIGGEMPFSEVQSIFGTEMRKTVPDIQFEWLDTSRLDQLVKELP